MIDLETREIRCISSGQGIKYEHKLFVKSKVRFHPDTKRLEDSGYKRISQLHKNSRLAKKKPKGGKLTRQEKSSNPTLARRRAVVEHLNRRLKVFRILTQPYSNRSKRFGLRCKLNAGLYNYELTLAAKPTC